jgi:hypothetical protein
MTVSGNLDPALRGLARELARMQQRIDQIERNQRASQLEFASIEGGALVVNDDQGNPMLQLGLQGDGTYSHVHLASSDPGAPSDPLLTAGITGIYITWDGLMADASAPLSDFDYVQLHVSPVSGFIPDSTTLVGRLAKTGVYAVGSLAAGVPVYVVLVPVGKDGTAGTPSGEATTTPTAVPDNIPPGGITGAMIGTGAVTGNNIAANSITAAHLVAGIIVAGIIDATVVNAAVFNGSVFNGTDFVFDPTGNYFYSGFPGLGNLVAAIVPPTTTADQFGNTVLPILEVAGVTNINQFGDVIIRNSFGAVVMYLSAAQAAFFQYEDTGSATQGALILAISSVSGNDPVNTTFYPAGQFGVDPVFGDSIIVTGANITLQQLSYTQQAKIGAQTGSGAVNPFVFLSAPEQGQSGHLAMLMQGTSPDGTQPSQLVIAIQPTGTTLPSPITQALFELKGQMASDCAYIRVPSVTPAARPAGTEFSHLFSTLGYQNGWLDGGRVPGKYRFIVSPPNSFHIFGSLKVPAGVAAGQLVVTLPAAYQPANPQSVVCRNTTVGNTTVWLSVDAAGLVKFQGPVANVAANDVIDFSGIISLDG